MQSDTVSAPNTWGVGLNETFLPQYLKSQGYANHAIGKVKLKHYYEFLKSFLNYEIYKGILL